MTWPEYYLEIAEAVKLKSKDVRTQIGAVIVGSDKQIVSTGYNSFPRNIVDNNSDRQVRPEKYYWMEHAEKKCDIQRSFKWCINKKHIHISYLWCSLL